MLLANEIAGFSSSQLYMQNKMVKNPDFLHADTNSGLNNELYLTKKLME